MIGLVRIALRRPYTMAIAGLLIVLGGFLAVTRMVVDIFPNIDIPVVYVAWNYPGLSAEDMERRVVLSAQNNSILRIAPPGITPPNMIRFNASNVPVVQVTLNSKTLPEQQIFDYGLNFLRTKLFTILVASSGRSSLTSIQPGLVPRACHRWTWSPRCRPPM
jgi:multidrug efflux pump subunit AcrB